MTGCVPCRTVHDWLYHHQEEGDVLGHRKKKLLCHKCLWRMCGDPLGLRPFLGVLIHLGLRNSCQVHPARVHRRTLGGCHVRLLVVFLVMIRVL